MRKYAVTVLAQLSISLKGQIAIMSDEVNAVELSGDTICMSSLWIFDVFWDCVKREVVREDMCIADFLFLSISTMGINTRTGATASCTNGG